MAAKNKGASKRAVSIKKMQHATGRNGGGGAGDAEGRIFNAF
jgi:hypothetical protein